MPKPTRADAFSGAAARLAGVIAGAFVLAVAGYVPPARAQAAVAPAAAFDLAQLTRMLSQVQSGSATFVERRTVSVLDRTLESSGRLSFEPPDNFVRETLKPRQERIAVAGNTVTMSRGSASRSMQLDSVPEAALIVEAIRGTLTGNREVLERSFVATVDGTPQRWTLDLKPREPRLRELVVSVRIGGAGPLVRQVEVAMADGDRSVMTIDPVVAAGPGGSATGISGTGEPSAGGPSATRPATGLPASAATPAASRAPG